jgi:hypothetical protein
VKAQYDIDSGTIQIWLPDGTEITMLVNEIEDSMDMTLIQRGEFTQLAYENCRWYRRPAAPFSHRFARSTQTQTKIISAFAVDDFGLGCFGVTQRIFSCFSSKSVIYFVCLNYHIVGKGREYGQTRP